MGFKKDRDFAKDLHKVADLNFLELFVDTPLEECARRDTKGLYARAQCGEITGLTGFDAPYETPENPDIHLVTLGKTVEQTSEIVLQTLRDRQIIKSFNSSENKLYPANDDGDNSDNSHNPSGPPRPKKIK